VKLRITIEGQSYEVDVEVLPEGGEIEESDFEVPPSVLQPPMLPDTRPEDRVCRSPIAGVVVALAAVPKQRVRQNDPVVVIEAMKMQTAIGAPVDGTIQEYHVAPGESVKPGQMLCTLA
jgi:methylmalonyl-CoA carboxyltransferase small subunit